MEISSRKAEPLFQAPLSQSAYNNLREREQRKANTIKWWEKFKIQMKIPDLWSERGFLL